MHTYEKAIESMLYIHSVFDQGWTKGWMYIAMQLKLILQHIVIVIFEAKLGSSLVSPIEKNLPRHLP